MTRIEAWERRTEWPLSIAALAFLLAYGLPIAAPDIPHAARTSCEVVVTVIWVAFAVDYLVRLALSPARARFVRRHLLDLAVIALPILRPLRLLRLVALIGILNRTGSSTLRGRVVTYVIGGTTLLVTCGALAVTDAERSQPQANITNLADGFWWAISTITTVGYGDRYPTTTTGRFVAVALMLGGIALLGVVTATLASWLVERVTTAVDDDQTLTRAHVEDLASEVRQLRAELERRHADPLTATEAANPQSSSGYSPRHSGDQREY